MMSLNSPIAKKAFIVWSGIGCTKFWKSVWLSKKSFNSRVCNQWAYFQGDPVKKDNKRLGLFAFSFRRESPSSFNFSAPFTSCRTKYTPFCSTPTGEIVTIVNVVSVQSLPYCPTEEGHVCSKTFPTSTSESAALEELEKRERCVSTSHGPEKQFSPFRPHEVNSLLLVPTRSGIGQNQKKKKKKSRRVDQPDRDRKNGLESRSLVFELWRTATRDCHTTRCPWKTCANAFEELSSASREDSSTVFAAVLPKAMEKLSFKCKRTPILYSAQLLDSRIHSRKSSHTQPTEFLRFV